jgi:hypothetical protein
LMPTAPSTWPGGDSPFLPEEIEELIKAVNPQKLTDAQPGSLKRGHLLLTFNGVRLLYNELFWSALSGREIPL